MEDGEGRSKTRPNETDKQNPGKSTRERDNLEDGTGRTQPAYLIDHHLRYTV